MLSAKRMLLAAVPAVLAAGRGAVGLCPLGLLTADPVLCLHGCSGRQAAISPAVHQCKGCDNLKGVLLASWAAKGEGGEAEATWRYLRHKPHVCRASGGHPSSPDFRFGRPPATQLPA